MKKTKAFIRSKACLKKQSVWKSRQVSSEWVTHHKGGLGCVYRGIFWVVSGQSPLQVVLVWAWRGFPGGARGKEPVCQCRRRETWVWSLGQEDLLEKGMATHSSLENLHGQRSLAGYSPWGCTAEATWQAGGRGSLSPDGLRFLPPFVLPLDWGPSLCVCQGIRRNAPSQGPLLLSHCKALAGDQGSRSDGPGYLLPQCQSLLTQVCEWSYMSLLISLSAGYLQLLLCS